MNIAEQCEPHIGTDDCKNCGENITNVGMGWYHDNSDDCEHCNQTIERGVDGSWIHVQPEVGYIPEICYIDDGDRYLAERRAEPACEAEPENHRG